MTIRSSIKKPAKAVRRRPTLLDAFLNATKRIDGPKRSRRTAGPRPKSTR